VSGGYTAFVTTLAAVLPRALARVHDDDPSPTTRRRLLGVNDGSESPVRPAMRVYRAEGAKPQRRGRRWLRVLGWITLVLVLAVAGLAAFAYWKINTVVSDITAINSPQESVAVNQHTYVPAGDKAPVTFVIFGVDKRPGETVYRADTTILVRLDPVKKVLTQLAIPRDWLVPVAGYGTRKITEAYALGGPALSLQTLYEQLGVQPNYYIQIDFTGFIRAVNAFNGVYVEVDRRYFNQNVNTAATNFMSVDLQPGYQKLKGLKSLEFVRFRHSDDDPIRNARQQEFLNAFKRVADPVSVGTRSLTLLDIADKNLRVKGKKRATAADLLRWATTSRNIPRANVINVRCASHAAGPQGYEIGIDPDALKACMDEFLDPDPTLAARASTATVGRTGPATPTGFKVGTVPVDVRNGSGVDGAATDASQQLVARGWKLATSGGEADNHEYLTTKILYGTRPASLEAARRLRALFAPADIVAATPADLSALPTPPASAPAADVVVIVGKSFDQLVKAKFKPLPPKAAAAVVTVGSQDLARWRTAQRKSKLRLWYPSRLPVGAVARDPQFPSTVDAFRVYRTASKPAVHVTYAVPAGYSNSVFGFQALGWSSPPLLESPTAKKVRNGVSYQLYFNGPKLHRVAWRDHGVWYWVSNTLLDTLTNATMWSVATSFRPVPR
jgi:LCP family protein required for cell wall assembly